MHFCSFELFFSYWYLFEKIKFKEKCFIYICIHFVFLEYFSYQIDVNVVCQYIYIYIYIKRKSKIKIRRKNGQETKVQNNKNEGLR